MGRMDEIKSAIFKLGAKHEEHVMVYGEVEDMLQPTEAAAAVRKNYKSTVMIAEATSQEKKTEVAEAK